MQTAGMKYVPNAITIVRILVTPVVLVLLMSDSLLSYIWAFGLFVLASISDYLDGKLARYFQEVTRLGRFLDPFADKVLVLGTFIALVAIIPQHVPWWAVTLVAIRDISVTVLRAFSESRGKSIRTLPLAKSKTAVQLTFIMATLLILTFLRVPGPLGEFAATVLGTPIPFWAMMIVTVFTVATGLGYFRKIEYVENDD